MVSSLALINLGLVDTNYFGIEFALCIGRLITLVEPIKGLSNEIEKVS